MPRPPILPDPDRRAIFASGVRWEQWLAAAADDEQGQAQQMRDLYAATTIPATVRASLGAIARPVHVIAIAECWCGDVVRHTPVLTRLIEACPQAQLRFITRMQYPEFFARFLTNGGEAIPKFVFCNDQFTECGNWGPMPEICRRWIAQGKACNDVKSARQRVGAYYELDKQATTIRELHELLLIASHPGF